MTTYYQFAPSNRKAPSFMPTLDGREYTIKALWNVSAQRYYLNCQNLSGTLIFMVPLITNPDPFEIAALEYDNYNRRVIATTAASHNLAIGTVLNISVRGCIPAAYNGNGLAFIISKYQIAYPLMSDPGPGTTMGVFDYFISMTKGYFLSTLIYRDGNFEVSP